MVSLPSGESAVVSANEVGEAISKVLPFLRRYARAMTGSQKVGDEWVRACAEMIAAQPELAADCDNSKLDMFKLFHRVLALPDLQAGGGAAGRLKESLTDMEPLPRQVLLLTVLEGFTVKDAASIVGVDPETADEALLIARRELQRVAEVRVLVIEDEAVIALDVADIVRNAGHQVVGIAATEKAAVDLAKQHSPHLILADIQLRGSDSGITAVNEIMKLMKVPVIYVTQYPERLLTGRHVEPAFVISKPFDPDLLRAAIAHALDTVSI
jgi:CheY-like chemotaxis protein